MDTMTNIQYSQELIHNTIIFRPLIKVTCSWYVIPTSEKVYFGLNPRTLVYSSKIGLGSQKQPRATRCTPHLNTVTCTLIIIALLQICCFTCPLKRAIAWHLIGILASKSTLTLEKMLTDSKSNVLYILLDFPNVADFDFRRHQGN